MGKVSEVFASRVRYVRSVWGISQKDLCELVGCSSKRACLYESGKRLPNIDILARYAKALEVSSDYLIGLSNDAGSSNYLRELMKLYTGKAVCIKDYYPIFARGKIYKFNKMFAVCDDGIERDVKPETLEEYFIKIKE